MQQLSSEALLAEYGGRLAAENARVSDELEQLQALLRGFQEGIRAALAIDGEAKR